jgi:hypothetical protein
MNADNLFKLWFETNKSREESLITIDNKLMISIKNVNGSVQYIEPLSHRAYSRLYNSIKSCIDQRNKNNKPLFQCICNVCNTYLMTQLYNNVINKKSNESILDETLNEMFPNTETINNTQGAQTPPKNGIVYLDTKSPGSVVPIVNPPPVRGLSTNTLPNPLDNVSVTYENAGKPWTDKEDKQLIDEYKSGISVDELCRIHKRNMGGISSRLVRLNLIDNRKEIQGYSEYRAKSRSLTKENKYERKLKYVELQNNVKEIKQEIKELKQQTVQLIEMVKAVYDFEKT